MRKSVIRIIENMEVKEMKKKFMKWLESALKRKIQKMKNRGQA